MWWKELLPRNSTQSELGPCRGTSCLGMLLLLMIPREAIFIYQGKQCFLRSPVRRVEVKWGRAFHHRVSAGLLILMEVLQPARHSTPQQILSCLPAQPYELLLSLQQWKREFPQQVPSLMFCALSCLLALNRKEEGCAWTLSNMQKMWGKAGSVPIINMSGG